MHGETVKFRYTVFFFFTGIVNDGRELKYKYHNVKQLNLNVKLTKCQYLRRTINTILYMGGPKKNEIFSIAIDLFKK